MDKGLLDFTDWLALAWLSITGMFLLFNCPGSRSCQSYLILHIAIILSIIALTRFSSGFIRKMYPLLLILLFYTEADLFAKILYNSSTFDGLVSSWDIWLFGSHPHEYLDQILAGTFWTEIFHFFYVSYYFLLVGGFIYASYSNKDFARIRFIVLGSFISFIMVFLVFPVAGPLINPGVSLTSTGLFPSIVAFLYKSTIENGIYTGAMPSSHIGMSVIISTLIWPKDWKKRTPIVLVVAGITIATVYGKFHYAIDAVAGLAAGAILYFVWNKLYGLVNQKLKISIK